MREGGTKMTGNFAEGKVWQHILRQSLPLMLAQLVQMLYTIVDRIYIGHIPGASSLALTGVGLCFPLITLIMAFTALFSTGGTPIFSISRGEGNNEKADRVLGSTAFLLIACSVIIMVFFYITRRPVLFLFGASEDSYYYADQYLRIYLAGTAFSMIQTGMNGFITAQGFPRTGMVTTLIGAGLNLVLDPLFIFTFGMNIAGAALATVISQFISCVWLMKFLTGRKALHRLERRYFRFDAGLTKEICTLGISGFIMQATNSLVQIVCNTTLQQWGGDLYVGIMTVLNSLRELLSLTVRSLTAGTQPVLGYNYGAKLYDRVKSGIRFMSVIGIAYTAGMWALILIFPRQFISLFTTDPVMIESGQAALRIYLFGFIFMSLQFAGQTTFQGLGKAKRAIFFSLLRKVIIVVPLTLLLPRMGYGVNGVFMAEPISDLIGGSACALTMYFTLYRRLGKE